METSKLGRRDLEGDILHVHFNSAAVDAAVDAAEACMRQLKRAKTEDEKMTLDRKCRLLIERAESLKIVKSKPTDTHKTILKLQEPRSDRVLSTREEIILLEGSRLYGSVFLPWKDKPSDSEFDLKPGELQFEYAYLGQEYLMYIMEYRSLLAYFVRDKTRFSLSEQQLEIFDGWKRPNDALPPPNSQVPQGPAETCPTMISEQSVDLVQDINRDCSVVASLCAGIARGSHGHSQITSSIFYPYDPELERPVISANGKYIFRMHFNGCYRKVIIDDLLPTSKTARTLHVIDRNNPGLLWPALLEKAYLKLRGGYDFPGSNSGTDLWVLTGWIPEQVFLHSEDIAPSSLWRRIFKAFSFGDVLATIGTGKLSEREEEWTGLVGEHNYAIVDMKEDGDRCILLIKNPWFGGNVEKGSIPISVRNGESQEFQLKNLGVSEMGIESMTAGMIWMDLKDALQNFGSMYLNWNPGLFAARQDIHFTWDITTLRQLRGSFAQNPQYRVHSNSGGIVWLLLSRHFTTETQASEDHVGKNRCQAMDNGNFISLYVFDNNGEKVFSKDGAVVRSPYVDSPNALLKLEYPANTSYTAVVSEQGLPDSSCNFTLTAFSLDTLIIGEARDKYSSYQKHDGSWSFATSGGNASSIFYSTNPQFSIRLCNASDVILLLESTEDFPIHLKLVWANGKRVTSITSRDVAGDSGEYRIGYAIAEVLSVQPGTYTIVCSTFEAGQIGQFSLRIGTMSECAVERVPNEGAGRMFSKLPTALFTPGIDRLLAPLFVHRVARLALIARPIQDPIGSSRVLRSPVRFTIESGQGPSKQILGVSGCGDFANDLSSLRSKEIDVEPKMCDAVGLWIVVERLGCSGVEDIEGVEIDVLCDEPIEIGRWGTGDG